MSIVTFILGILLIMGGIGCFFTPIATSQSLSWIFGICIIVAGVSAIIQFAAGRKGRSGWEVVEGILGIIFGFLLVFNTRFAFFTNIVLAYVIAIGITAYGVCKIIASFKMRKLNKALPDEMKSGAWLVSFIVGILIVIAGLVCFFEPLAGMAMVGYLIAFYIISSGIDMIAASIMSMRMGH